MTLPLLLSIPHGGDRVPPEATPKLALSAADIFSDGDACTRTIYDLSGVVTAVHQTDIARAVIDLNRAPEDRAPQHPDGVVKSLTTDRIPVWRDGGPPSRELADILIDRYWRPYHARLETLAANPDLILAIDCHSMADVAPAIAAAPGAPRPLFCLSNATGDTAPDALLHALADALAESFDCPHGEIGINAPFQGGHITRWHGRRFRDGGIPWIQVEMNRRWYLSQPWFDHASRIVDEERLLELRRRFRAALEALPILRA